MYKYSLPKLKSDIYIRKNLIKLFNQNSYKKLIYIEGEAGIGKTTFLSMLFNEKENFSYLICDEFDKNKNIFLKSLIISLIKNEKPSFKIPQNELLNYIINFLNNKKDDFYLIIDDFHEIIDEEHIIETIKFIIKNTDENVHLIVSCRYNLPETFYIDILRERVSIISSDDLKFKKIEIKEFFNFKKIKIDSEEIENIYRKSNGWILYINLISKFYNEKIRIFDSKIIDRFFKEEIFKILKEDEIEVLKVFTICEVINKNLVEKFHKDWNLILGNLSRRNLFVEEDENFFRIHPIFKEEILKNYGYYEKEKSIKIAEFLEKNEIYKDALNIYKIYDEKRRMIRLIEKWGMKLLEKEEIFVIEEFLKLIPKDEYTQKLFMFLCEIEKNKGNLINATNLIRKINEKNFNINEKNYLNLLRGEIEYLNGNYKKAEKILSKIKLDNYLEIKRLHLLGLIKYFLNDYKSFKKLLENALKLSERLNDLYRIIKIHNDLVVGWYEPKGDIITSEILLKKAIFLTKKNNLTINPIILGNLSYINDLLGEFEEGIKIGSLALKIARKMQDKSKIIFILRVLSSIYIKKGDLTKAKEILEEALNLTEECPDPSRKIGILYNLSFLYEKMKNIDKAIYFANEDLSLTMKMDNKKFIAQSYLNFGRIYLRFKDYEKSKIYLNKAKEFFEKSDFLLNLFETYLFLFINALTKKDELENLKIKIKKLIDQKGFSFYIKSVLTREEQDYFKKRFEIEREKKFSIKTFGVFSLFRDGSEVKDNEWKRESTKDLFKYLIIKKGRALKDEIYEDIFPNLSIKSKSTSLRVSISHLKRVLEPNLKNYEKSKYLKIDKDLVYLNLDEFYIDSYEFEEISKRAIEDKDIELLLNAINLYKDRFLNEDRYKDFVIHKTYELEEIYINLLNICGELLINKRDKEKGLEYLRKSLQIDPFQDEILKKYFYYLIKLKKRALANKVFKEFKEKYKKNWDIDISKIVNLNKIL